MILYKRDSDPYYYTCRLKDVIIDASRWIHLPEDDEEIKKYKFNRSELIEIYNERYALKNKLDKTITSAVIHGPDEDDSPDVSLWINCKNLENVNPDIDLYPYRTCKEDFLKYLRKRFPNFIVDEASSLNKWLRKYTDDDYYKDIYKERLGILLKKMTKSQLLEYTLKGGILYDE